MINLNEIPLEELSKATNPFHIDLCTFDSDRIRGAYPTLIVDQMVTEFNQQNNEYIAKECVRLDIDRDVLMKQTEELIRLNTSTQSLCDKAYQKGRDDLLGKATLDNGELCWQECCATERCGRCKRLDNGDIDYFEHLSCDC